MNVFTQAEEAIKEFMNNPDKEKITIVLDKDYHATGNFGIPVYIPHNPTLEITCKCISNVED